MRKLSPFRVHIEGHVIPPRWNIPEREKVVYAPDERLARKYAIRDAGRDAGIPPLRSLMALSWEHTTATPEPEYKRA